MAIGPRHSISNHQTVKDWALAQDGEFTRHDMVKAGLAPNIRTAGLVMNKLALEGLEFATRKSGGYYIHYDMKGKPSVKAKAVAKVSEITLARLREWVSRTGVFTVADVEAAELQGLRQRSSILPALKELRNTIPMTSQRDGLRITYTVTGYEAPSESQIGSWEWAFKRMNK